MKAKYFTADSFENAAAMACEYFQCTAAELKIDVISGGGDDGPAVPWFVVAVQGETSQINNMDAFFSVYYEQDGVYLEIYARRGSGASLNTNDLADYLGRKRIQGLSMSAIQSLTEQGYGRAKIAQAQKEYLIGEDMTVVVSGDETEAVARLLAPEPGGAALTLENAKKILAAEGVVHGVDDTVLSTWLASKIYNEPYVVARATPPVDGEDGRLVFHFSTEPRTGKPREITSSGRVDYRSLDLYVPVTEGQLLVSKIAATEGKPGTTVRGNIINQRLGKEAAMPRGKNVTLNDDRTEMKSNCSGMVEFVNNAINVSNVYSIKGDCDMSTGNIDFEGSVHISGSVRNGSVVKATDGINIGGSVEAATLIAGGNIEVKGGMMGADKGSIEAGGAVSIMFVERGKVSADGPISVDVSIHSTLETGSTIHALGKRGAIIGGQASAAGDIVASFIGALSNTRTSVEVGFLPRKRARVEELEKEMERIRADQLKLTQLDAYLEKTKGTMDKATWDKLFISGAENKKINAETAANYAADIEQLRNEMANATNSRVHVLETAFNGTRITIGACSFKVVDDISFATFRHSDGEIVYGPCEKNKADFK